MAKHINYEQTKTIEKCLDQGLMLNEIANLIDKDPRAISRHIKNYRTIYKNGKFRNQCGRQKNCEIKHLCDKCANGICKYCSLKNCNKSNCESFTENPCCDKLQKFPFVCNGCTNIASCKEPKYVYNHEIAYKEKTKKLSLSRSHITIDSEMISLVDEIITPLVKKGISLEVILRNHPELGISLTTLYTYIDKGIFSIKNIDLKRKVRYKARKRAKTVVINYSFLENRCYEDFIKYIVTHSNDLIRELDTIEGRKGGKAVMSLLCRQFNFQLLFLINSISTGTIIEVFDTIKFEIGESVFRQYFPIILTDLINIQ